MIKEKREKIVFKALRSVIIVSAAAAHTCTVTVPAAAVDVAHLPGCLENWLGALSLSSSFLLLIILYGVAQKQLTSNSQLNCVE